MAYRALFSDSEWRTLQFTPLWVFGVVAGADGKIDDKETAVLTKEVMEAPLYKGAFVRELMMSLASELGTVVAAYKADPRSPLVGLVEARGLLTRIESSQAAVFKFAVMSIGNATAQASSPLFAANKASPEEQTAWGMAAVMLGFDLKESQAAVATL